MFAALNLRKMRLREQKKLNKSNLSLYKNMTAYIQISNSSLTFAEKEEVLQQIMDILLQAQMEKKSVDLFIGKDYEVFCNSIIDEFNNSKGETYRVVKYVQACLLYMLILIGIKFLLSAHPFSLNMTIEELIDISIFSLVIVPVIRIRKFATFTILNHKFRVTYMGKAVVIFLTFFIKSIIRTVSRNYFGITDISAYYINLYFSYIGLLALLITIGLIELFKINNEKKL